MEDIMAFATCSVGVRGLVSFTASGAAFSFYYDFFSGALCWTTLKALSWVAIGSTFYADLASLRPASSTVLSAYARSLDVCSKRACPYLSFS